MSDDYFTNRDRLLSVSDYTSDVLRTQIDLFSTWTANRRYRNLETAAVHLDAYEQWLVAWGFPARLAAAHVQAIRRCLEAVI